MISKRLGPCLDLLREEYVLVQAWKKTAAYIRYHNWFSDPLALDRASVNLPWFIDELRERIQSAEDWQNDSLRIVPAPKSQRWEVSEGKWAPQKQKQKGTPVRIRPLAHVSLADQVVATGLMLCLADRVETRQGDTRRAVNDPESRRQVISYGNRLFCDVGEDGELHHRWGSAKLYRAYYQDYRKFLSRPKIVADSISPSERTRVYVVHADIKQFYDRVRPDMLFAAIGQVRRDSDDPAFFSLAASLLDWGWDSRDERDVQMYAKQAGIEDFTRVALPQGLVASGFFANILLLAFDERLRTAIGTEIVPGTGIRLEDACRYVDDLRIVISLDSHSDGSAPDIREVISTWLGGLLNENAPGLALSSEKTQIVALGKNKQAVVRQSAKMSRIQSRVSGGFDAFQGEEILDAIQGLMRAQEGMSAEDESGWRFAPVPDVRDETVARFGAARYRITFRSIRPLLQDNDTADDSNAERDDSLFGKRLRTRGELDEDARAFALSLIKRWIDDPSNVRLLRIGLDLLPDKEVLREILELLRPFTETGECYEAPQQVAWYCLSEILRAGATETGLVPDTESLPLGIDLESYRTALSEEAVRLAALPGKTIPWYLRQQALLFLAVCDPKGAPVVRPGREPELHSYWEIILFLRGEANRVKNSSDFATLAVLARRAFVDRDRAIELTRPGISPSRKRQIFQRDPSFLLEILQAEEQESLFDGLSPRAQEDLCRMPDKPNEGFVNLAEEVLRTHPKNSLRNEIAILRFAKEFLIEWRGHDCIPEVITPVQVEFRLTEAAGVADVKRLRILGSRVKASESMYEAPSWCEAGQQWRFQLGFLLRFILSGERDFTRPVRSASWKEAESAYRSAGSHWYQRLYGLYSAQPAFGDDWAPITDWVENFLLALLRWPGCHAPEGFGWVEKDIDETRTQICERIARLEERRGNAADTLILPLLAKRPTATKTARPLRACVAQTVIPSDDDFKPADLSLDEAPIRRKHRNHLSATLAAVERMLALRGTHKEGGERLDWLILPELAVHPKDIRTHLIPFARARKTMILAGLTYEEIIQGEPLVNSALWVIPEWSEAYGLQIKIRRQGKKHLARDEQRFNDSARVLQGFRPCQWLIGYPWSGEATDRPVWLTAALCYDATDIGLAADLKEQADILAIPALNKDVSTFDHMAQALHYHMFQLVIVANNGKYGGSNAYWPRKGDHIKQIFHVHGQPQASVAFLEIEDVGAYLQRHGPADADDAQGWKHPPANLRGGSTSN